MVTSSAERQIETLEVVHDVEIAASIDIVFETILEQLGPLNETPDHTPLPMNLEPWPGGRWFRDFGNNRGHFWGHVQSFRPNDLLEIHGPLFMAAPAVSHVQYRLAEEGGITRVKFSHRAVGQIPHELLDGVDVNKGWTHHFNRVKEAAERQHGARR
jgi:uncharacterized protein YndB with AHSA1/START domain